MRVGEELVGVLTLWSRQTGGLGERQEEIALEVADQLAVAIRQARLLEQVQAHAEEMEARVEERTRELAERNEELQTFAYSVSHDLRAPLRAMQGFGQALIEDYGPELDPVAADFTRRIVEAAGHMDELIQDLLAYSRLSLAQLTLQPVSLEDVLAETIRHLHGEIAERSATVIVDASGHRVLGHRATLIQIVANLLTNALKFVPQDRAPEVRIGTRCSGDTVRLSVEDNGIGIGAEHAERIFGIFERLHGTDVYPGTGIGLAIVKKAADRLGGSVGVESTPGEGSIFWVELPAA
jgi:signal transduction histidine kinase